MKNGFASFRTPADRKARRGFTLTELLLVIIIMAILAAMSITVQRSAVESTRRERTIVTIRKIDAALTSAYEKYQYRKPDVNYFIRNIEEFVQLNLGNLPEDNKRQVVYQYLLSDTIEKYSCPSAYQQFSFVEPELQYWRPSNEVGPNDSVVEKYAPLAPYIRRTLMLRELLLADFPDSLEEVDFEGFGYAMKQSETPVHQVYRSWIPQLREAKNNSKDGDISADLLYLIVMNTNPEIRGTFLERETADTNGNGILEFVDGWGNPIRFIRWLPPMPLDSGGSPLLESNRQPAIDMDLSLFKDFLEQKRFLTFDPDSLSTINFNIFQDSVENFETDNPGVLEYTADPFDPIGSMNGCRLTPFIYSAGPDKAYGMGIGENCGESEEKFNTVMACYPNGGDSRDGIIFVSPFSESPPVVNLRQCIEYNKEFTEDNITNHYLE
ncbi:MAG: type II secretion system protein [Thermoguttaceae bacterium]|nr:type II secretion system protein [Thermoguttaceae bacterium]